MSKLQELINKLCPNGVEFKPLGEVCEIKTGKGITKNDATGGGNYPIISGGQTPMGYYYEYNRGPKTVTISRVGAYAGFVSFIEKPFYLNDKCFSIIPINDFQTLINSRFLFHHLKNKEETIKNLQSEGGVPTINTKKVGSIMIPVPPIEVQEEIVRILDSFSDYAAELQAELQARKQQYEYYRNLLLTFNPSAYGCGTDDEQKDSVTTWGGHNYKIQWKKMGEICKSINTGLNPRKFFKLNTPDANGYYVTIREIRNGRIIFSEKTDRINNAALKLCNNRSNIESGDVLFSGTGTIGQVAVVHESPSNWNIKEGVYAIKPITCIISPFFLRYLLESKNIKDSIMKRVAGGTVQSISMAELKNIVIPIPPLELQEKIASILDRFETLVNDLTNGLPAEIAAVKDQYEYYRNKLLTFKILSA